MYLCILVSNFKVNFCCYCGTFVTHTLGTVKTITQSHLRTLMINVEVPGVIAVLVGELQPMRMTNLFWLKGGVQVLDGYYSFGAFGLLSQIHTHALQIRRLYSAVFNTCLIFQIKCVVSSAVATRFE